jgi:hypothetical protein
MSNKPVAAYAFVTDGYPERVIFSFLNKILDFFLDKYGEKWRTFKDDTNLSI